jgi:hypothetical protein
VVRAGSQHFRGTNTGILEPGWRAVYGTAAEEEDAEGGAALPVLQPGAEVQCSLPPTIQVRGVLIYRPTRSDGDIGEGDEATAVPH